MFNPMQIQNKTFRIMTTKTLTIAKTTKIIGLSIVLFSISASSFGQIKNFREDIINHVKEIFFNKAETNDLFIPVVYYVEAELVMAPSISRTIYTSSLEVVYEAEVAVENWMTASFETAFEESVALESWMTAPFEVAFEEAVAVESWMTTPFESAFEESVAVESWMTTPFESAFEESVAVEGWMTTPFEPVHEEGLIVENWMADPQTWLN